MSSPQNKGYTAPLIRLCLLLSRPGFLAVMVAQILASGVGMQPGPGRFFVLFFRLFVLAGAGQGPGSGFLIVVEDRFLSILGLCDLGDGG